MKHAAIRKLNSKRGSSIAEALVGFLISVLSVITLLNIANTTMELIRQGDASIQVLYDEEGAMDGFVNGATPASEYGTAYTGTYTGAGGSPEDYTMTVQGVYNFDPNVPNIGEGASGQNYTLPTAVGYYVTNRHHLFGFRPTT